MYFVFLHVHMNFAAKAVEDEKMAWSANHSICILLFGLWYLQCCICDLVWCTWYLVFGVSLYSHINIGAVEDEKMAWSANHSIWARPAVSPHTIYKHGWIYASHIPYFSVSFNCISHLLEMHFSDLVWGNSQMFSYLCFFL